MMGKTTVGEANSDDDVISHQDREFLKIITVSVLEKLIGLQAIQACSARKSDGQAKLQPVLILLPD